MSFTKNDWEQEWKQDTSTSTEDRHESLMKTDWEYFLAHCPQVDAIEVLLEELTEETYWEAEAILEYLAEPYKG